MIKEAYCSKEVAKLLREKGFDIPVNYEYHYTITIPQFHKKKHDFNGNEYRNYSSEWYSAPTHQMAMAWIVEKYNVSIEISALKHNCWVYTIYKILDDKVKELYNDGEFKSHEEAVEAACIYLLENLI